MQGTLFVGSMPIGNMDDVTIRMLKAFKNCDIIFSDTPTDYLNNILSEHNITKPIEILKSTNTQFADKDQVAYMMSLLYSGKNVLLVSSEGQIGIADPGNQFIQECIKKKIKYTILPGPNVFVNSYVASGYVEGDFFVSSSMNNPIDFLSNHKNKHHPLVILVWYKDIFEVLNYISNNYDNERYITLCVNMTLGDELFIYDKVKNILKNEKINLLNENSKISLVVSGNIEVDFRPD